MKITINLVLLLFLFSCSHAQNSIPGIPLTGNVKDDIVLLLPEGKYQVDIMDKVEMEPKTQLLMQKFQTAVQKNPEWFVEHQQRVKNGEPLPYDKRLGLTKAEYEELMNLSKNPSNMRMTKSGSGTVIIKHVQGKLTFEGSGRLKVLNELTIDLQDLTANLGEIKLPEPEAVNVNTADNGLRSKWNGYSWRFEKTNKEQEEIKSIADYQDLEMQLYKVTIGQLETTGKTYIDIKGSEVEGGQRTVNFQIPLIIQ
jgi:hypothetical protein